jgi:Uma2 family endonuclease
LPVLPPSGTFEPMKALLELPEIRKHAMRFSVEDYHRFTEGQPTELLRGVIIEKMSKSPLHRYTSDELREILAPQLTSEFTLFHEGPVSLPDSEPEPDIAIARGNKDDFRRRHPATADLVIEVAVSSLEIDRVKALIYAEAGVQEYWIVCPELKQVEVYRQPGPEGYESRTIVAAPVVLECAALPGVRVDLGELFA